MLDVSTNLIQNMTVYALSSLGYKHFLKCLLCLWELKLY